MPGSKVWYPGVEPELLKLPVSRTPLDVYCAKKAVGAVVCVMPATTILLLDVIAVPFNISALLIGVSVSPLLPNVVSRTPELFPTMAMPCGPLAIVTVAVTVLVIVLMMLTELEPFGT